VSQRDRLVSRLFRLPTDGRRQASSILRDTAEAHRRLLHSAASESTGHGAAGRLLPSIAALLDRPPGRLIARRLLVDPAFVEGLHRASGISRVIADWHRRVAEPSIAKVCLPADAESAHRLGNMLLVLQLRDDPTWCGRIALRTDVYGRLRFPLSDWSLSLEGPAGSGSVLSDERVTATLSRTDVRFSLGARAGREFFVASRSRFMQMIVGNEPNCDARELRFGSSDVTPRLQFAGAIPGRHVRYEPVTLGGRQGHAALTGGVVAAALNAIARNSPAIGREFDGLMSAARGWELPAATYGTIQSFSDPTLPRVMGINVPYGPDVEPCICPFCFTWFGHELGHTKSYLIETILHVRGEQLTTNQSDYTDVIERYGRPLSLRTVMQVPYTHLYEWTLLMDFLDRDFAGLPWEIADDPLEFGEDIREEIAEAFDRIEQAAKLTPCGLAAVARLHSLFSEAQVRWQAIRGRVPGKTAHVTA
jgi:hypothetical protein